MPQTTAHLIYGYDGNLARVCNDDTEAEMARQEDRDVFLDAEPLDILEELPPLRPKTVMDDTTWQQIGPALASAVSSSPIQARDTAMPLILPNLPAPILAARFNTLERIFDPSLDLLAYLKLSEVDMAYDHQREPSIELFPRAHELSWDTIYQVDPAKLDASVQAEQDVVNEMAADSGITNRTRALAHLNLLELEYALQTHPALAEEPALRAM